MKNIMCTLALVPGLLASSLALAGEQIDRQIDVPKDGKIIIENDRGEVEIRAWNEASFKVSGELDDLAKGYKLETRGQITEFIVDMPKRNGRFSKDGDGSKLVIYMPTQSALELEGVSLDVTLAELSNHTSIKTVNGNIKAKQLSGKTNLATVNGDIDSHNLDGDIHLETVNGNINDKASSGYLRINAVNGEIESHSKAHQVKFENVNGEVELTLEDLAELDFNTVNGEATIKVLKLADDARIDMNSVSGDATLLLPKGVSANFDIQTHAGGSIRNQLSDEKASKAKYGPSKRLSFSTEGGKGNVEIDTVSGTITIKSH
ncbi:DUF4097 domain-containing protein [Pseudoalteromonas fenneropenaei]|uniref:DUF4097 domain-containing protein n=1 Tax=Pseudoalteromonas fenneropenaei TaxID=1737459 RepID=A0ABV7CM53_9GAMM